MNTLRDGNTVEEIYRAHVLIVDDVPENVETLGELLAADYEIQFATSGAEALDLLHDHTPDLILLDVMMPEMDGYETCRRIKARPHLVEVPVIFVTALSGDTAETRGLELGAVDYIGKPINLDIARLRIGKHIQQRLLGKSLERALRAARQGLWEWHVANDVLSFNSRWPSPLGYETGETPHYRNWSEMLYPQHLPQLQAAIDAHFRGETPVFDVEVRIRNKEDYWSWVQIQGQVFKRNHLGEALYAAGTLQDIGERKSVELALRERESRMNTLLESMQDTVLVIDTSGLVTRCHVPTHLPNNQSSLLVAKPSSHSTYYDLLSPEAAESMDAAVTEILMNEAPAHFFACQGTPPNQQHFQVVVSPLPGIDELPSGYLLVARDVTNLKVAEEKARELAEHDALTGLPNRRLLYRRMLQAQRASERRLFYAAALFIDMDRFKLLNDSHGHEAGDKLLIEVAQRLQLAVRTTDTVARVGGDEFVVLLEDLSIDLAEATLQASQIGEKIRTSLNVDYDLGALKFHSTPSIGVALFRGRELDSDEILRRADQAMYAVKQAGRNAVRVYDF